MSGLGTDLSALIATLGTSVVESLPITGLRSRTFTRATFRLTLADGRVLKGRRLDSPADADRIRTVVTRLGRPEMPRIVAHRGAALLEEWIVGEPALQSRADVAFIERCGGVLGIIHGTPLGTPPIQPQTRPEPAAQYDRVECALAELLQLGVLSARVAADLRTVAREHLPAEIAVGFVHRDFCGENIVRGPGGAPFVVDNGSVGVDAIEFDLARTWYRWPLPAAQRRAFDAGYRAHRQRAGATEQFPFWAVAVLSEATLFRIRARTAGWRVPLRRLERLLRDRRRHGPDVR
jgi:hypothetical protein